MVGTSPWARGFRGPNKAFFPPGSLPPANIAAWERQTREELKLGFVPSDEQLRASGNLPLWVPPRRSPNG